MAIPSGQHPVLICPQCGCPHESPQRDLCIVCFQLGWLDHSARIMLALCNKPINRLINFF